MSTPENKAVFLSYASQDADAARRICEALRAAGVEVWFDQSELVGGDAWDAKIRKQIKDCALFVPVISAASQARREGYFRLEWKLAAQRTHTMADGTPFLLPVVIDATKDGEALVPEEFRAVQWTRLAGGEASEVFCARVKKLLRGDEVARGFQPVSAEDAGWKARATKKPTPWLMPTTLGVSAIVLLTFWRPWKTPPPVPRIAPASVAVAADPDLERAEKLLRGLESTGEDLLLAEEIVKGVVARRPGDASAAILYALINNQFVLGTFDLSEERFVLARRFAERAVQLAPDDPYALAALGTFLSFRSADLVRSEKLLRRAIELRPNELLFHGWLAFQQEVMQKPAEAVAVAERAARLFPHEALPLYYLAVIYRDRGDMPKMEQALDRALAIAPRSDALLLQGWAQCWLHGDLAALKSCLDRLPEKVRLSDRATYMRFVYAALSGEANEGRQALQSFPGTWIRDPFLIVAPKALLVGDLLAAEGKSDLARVQYEAALVEIGREKARDPAQRLVWKAELWVLVRLGRVEEARAVARIHLSALKRPYRPNQTGDWWFSPIAAYLELGERDKAVELLRDAVASTAVRNALHVAFRIHPRLAAWRGDKEIAGLLAEPAATASNPTSAPPSAADAKSVAVLAFENRSSEKDSEYFSDGVGDELINVLGRVPGLRVVGRTSSYSFKGKPVPSQEIGRALNVAHLIEGSVQRAGGKVRVIARLIRADTSEQVWSDSFEPDVKDIFAAQIDVAQAIARALSLRLGVTASGSRRVVNPDALQLYLQGRQLWSHRLPTAMDRAESLFQQALRLDPALAQARTGLADVWLIRGSMRSDPTTRLGTFSGRDSPEIDRVIAEAEAALAQDPSLAEAHATIGNARSSAWDTPGALESLRRAIELNPNYAPAHHWLGRVLLRDGRMAEGIAALVRAVELDPLSPIILDNYGMGLLFSGRPDDALPVIERALLLRPNHHQTLAWKIWALTDLGRKGEALDLARRVELTPDEGDNIAFASAYALREAGETGEAEAFARKLTGYRRFIATAGSGHPAEALPFLDPPLFSNLLIHYLLFLPALDPVRSDPQFASVLATLGLTEAHARAQAWRAANPPQKTKRK